MAQINLDCTNLNCPMPIVRISQCFKTLTVGYTIEVRATDPAFRADVEAWIRKTGQKLLSFKDESIKTALLEKIS